MGEGGNSATAMTRVRDLSGPFGNLDSINSTLATKAGQTSKFHRERGKTGGTWILSFPKPRVFKYILVVTILRLF